MSNVKNIYNTEASLKYFIIQVLASATLLFLVTIKTLTEDLFLPATITHVPVAAVLVLNTPDDGRLRPKHVE
jgi:NADH:ubiquinone oxidoreductase subunit 2 (subunit N)